MSKKLSPLAATVRRHLAANPCGMTAVQLNIDVAGESGTHAESSSLKRNIRAARAEIDELKESIISFDGRYFLMEHATTDQIKVYRHRLASAVREMGRRLRRLDSRMQRMGIEPLPMDEAE